MPYSADLDNVINGLSEIENLLEARLRQINTAVKLNGALNRHSINTDIEVYFAEFLNILFDWDLIEANFSGHNEPGIDLVSDKDKVVVQVSSSANSAKVKESLRKTPKVYKKNGYHFYFVTTALNLPPYKAKFGKEAKVMVIHAGLECGILGSKYPHWDMVSFGPTLVHPHSPDEALLIESVQPFWDFVVETLKNIPEKEATA